MNKTNIGILWNEIKRKMPEFNLTLSQFEEAMKTTEQRQRFFTAKWQLLKNKGVDLGKYDDFEKKYGGSTATPPPNPGNTNTVWSCIQKAEEHNKIKPEQRIKQGADAKQMVKTHSDGDKWYYYEDHTFKNVDDGQEVKGTWACDGESDYIIELETGWKYSSKKMVWESKSEKDVLSSAIRKTLIETKESKIIENNIIESRFKVILEGIDFSELSNDKKIKLSFDLFEEISSLSKQEFLNENNLLDTFKGLFGDDINSLPETFYKPWVDKVLKVLNMTDSYLREYLISQLTKSPSEVWSSFEDCEKMTNMIAKALSETLIFHMKMDKDFSSITSIRNSMEETMREEVFIKKLENKIKNTICTEFDKYASNADNILQKLKS